MKSIKITGLWTRSASLHEKEIARKTIKWCIKSLGLGRIRNLNIQVNLTALYGDCWGYCEEGNTNRSYILTIANNQNFRDFVMTIMHEMVHVRQWVRNEWTGDGEEEAWKLQEELTDKFLKENIL